MADSNRPTRVLFSVRDGDRFPADLWHRFRAIVTAQDRGWIDVLRELVDGYVRRHENRQDP